MYSLVPGTVTELFHTFPEPVIFHILIVLVILNLLNLSRKWDKVIKKWQKVEETLPQYEKAVDRTALARRINSIAFVFFMSAFGLYDFLFSLFGFCFCYYYMKVYFLYINFLHSELLQAIELHFKYTNLILCKWIMAFIDRCPHIR